MRARTLPTVGFDRFIKLEWMNQALDLALADGSPEEMHAWLSPHIAGVAARRKTSNLLTNLWLLPYPETRALRLRGLELARTAPNQRVALHWGMALANFPVFNATAQIAGRLLRLHGEFSTQEVAARIMEDYSNLHTIVRAVARMIQSMTDWAFLSRRGNRYHQPLSLPPVPPDVLEWLLAAVLSAGHKRRWLAVDLLRANVLFPFDLGENAAVLLHRSSYFEVVREALDQEIVGLSSSPPPFAAAASANSS